MQVLEAAERRELVDRVANSRSFQKSPRLRDFLLYVAECTISERLDDVREQLVGHHVFNRKFDYNPGQDNIVRVEARLLRKRLESYFQDEGKDEPLRIVMPRGSYAIAFEPRDTVAEAPELPDEPRRFALSVLRIPAWALPWKLLLAVLVAIVVSAAAWTSYKRQISKQSLSSGPLLPFSALFEDTRGTYIVTSDTGFVLIQEALGRLIGLDDYIRRRYVSVPGALHTPEREWVERLANRQYTNALEVGIATRMVIMGGAQSHTVTVRSAQKLSLADFKNHNLVLIGSPMGNAWARLFADGLNFQFDLDAAHRGMFRNRSARAGEPQTYSMTTDSGQSGQAFAQIAFIPNLNGEGNVLLIAGTTAEGTEAAGEFILDRARTVSALRSIGIDPAGPPRYFEMLLDVNAIAGTASHSHIVAARLIR